MLPATDPTSLRERKKQRTRQAIRDAALRLARERGPQEVTVEDIAAAAEVSPRTFFNYFASKEEAVVAVKAEVGEELAALLEARPACESSFEALAGAVLAWCEELDGDPAEVLQRTRIVRSDPHLLGAAAARWRAIEMALAAAVAKRRGREAAQDGFAALVAAVTLAAAATAIDRWSETGGRLKDHVAANLAAVAAGLPEPEGSRP